MILFTANELLGVPENASIEQIKAAYKARAKLTHPDTGGDADLFGLVQRAYEVLMQTKKTAKPKPTKATSNLVGTITLKIPIQSLKDNIRLGRAMPHIVHADAEFFKHSYTLEVTLNVMEPTKKFFFFPGPDKHLTTITGSFIIPQKAVRQRLKFSNGFTLDIGFIHI